MEKITVKRDVLLEFLSLLQLSGEITSNEAIFIFKQDSIKVIGVTANKVLAYKGELKGEFADWGLVGINNLIFLKNFLNSFTSETIVITRQKNKLEFTSPTEKIHIKAVLTNPDYITNRLDETKFDSFKTKSRAEIFTISTTNIGKICKYASQLKTKDLILEKANTNLSLKLELNENEIVSEFDVTEKTNDFKIKVSSLIVNILNAVRTDISVSMNNNAPIYINTKTDDYNVEYIVATIKL